MNSKDEILTIVDFVKFLCAIMVVGIHAQPFGDRLTGDVFTTFFRIAVPFLDI